VEGEQEEQEGKAGARCIARGPGWRIHFGVEVTDMSTNKRHTLSPLAEVRHVRDVSGNVSGKGVPC